MYARPRIYAIRQGVVSLRTFHSFGGFVQQLGEVTEVHNQFPAREFNLLWTYEGRERLIVARSSYHSLKG